MWTFHGLFGTAFSLHQMFDSESLSYSQNSGWGTIVCFLLVGVFNALLLGFIVERTKKCFDFTFTLYFVHFVLVCLYR